MYGLPRDFTGDFLVGRTLEAVLFNENQIQLLFDRKVAVSIMGEFQHQLGVDHSPCLTQDVPVKESQLMRLAGCSVVNALGTANGSLRLVFDTGEVVTVFDCPGYESYTIFNGDDTIYV